MQSMGLGGLFGYPHYHRDKTNVFYDVWINRWFLTQCLFFRTNKEEVPEPEVVVEEPHDIKDTETFQYEMYETIPEFTEVS